jgi:asparagine synthase (glutamine-hydrolysing)
LTGKFSGWNAVLDEPGVHVICVVGREKGSLAARPLACRSGVVLGAAFRRSAGTDEIATPRTGTFTNAETDQILATDGRKLIDAYWGRYVAFITRARDDTTWVVKDPTGRLPCFITECEGISFVFSYMPDFVVLGAGPIKVNWSYVAARVALGAGRPDDTGIDQVSEVCGGECLAFRKGRLSRRLYWNPASFISRKTVEEPAATACSLRSTVRACVHVWASTHETWLHRLSGGFDSSVVLACLTDAPSRPRVVCLTYHRPGGVSDERPWARLATQRVGCEHVEYARDPYIHFDALSRINRSASPPPTSSFLETDALEQQLAGRYRATAISSGDGGDSLFGSTAARYSVADYARRHGLGLPLLRLASDVALLRNQTVWTVLSRTCREDLFSRDRELTNHIREARKLAHPEIREPLLATRRAFDHPWFRSGRPPPGIGEILSLLTVPDLFYPPLSDPDEGIEPVLPLLSQPVVELCLSIPSYIHFDEGRDRGLARRAFAGDVPEAILARTWKDRVQGFPEEILRVNRSYFREMLLEGILVKERYLDRRAIETTLSGKLFDNTASVGEILDHILVETWLRSWVNQNSTKAVA